jgi:4-hydroxy-tetrahydrodipicolinate synthase
MRPARQQAGFKDFEVICGCDDQPVDFFFWGAKGWIAGAANVFPGEQVALQKAARAGDWDRARAMMRAMYPALHSMESGDYNQKAKAGCLNGTLDAGDVRLPLAPLDAAAKQAFRELVRGG